MKEFVSKYIGRIVTFVVTPVILPVATAFAVWAQDNLGVNLHGDQLTAYIVTTVAGLAIVIYKWVANLGLWERMVASIEHLHDEGARYPVE